MHFRVDKHMHSHICVTGCTNADLLTARTHTHTYSYSLTSTFSRTFKHAHTLRTRTCRRPLTRTCAAGHAGWSRVSCSVTCAAGHAGWSRVSFSVTCAAGHTGWSRVSCRVTCGTWLATCGSTDGRMRPVRPVRPVMCNVCHHDVPHATPRDVQRVPS